jgi:formylglycine-generating enzyme required for sulfatase activity/predicted Ser/Thr protein kinase/pimeloyl-ACP methyl ester carboxylesterase
MDDIEPERWNRIEQLYHSAAVLEPDERATFLDRACEGDPRLRQELESLLAHDHQAEDFIESPALQFAADQLGRGEDQSMEGQEVGHYRIGSLLGAGGMGVVYKARDLGLDRTVAIKLLPEDFVGEEQWRERFRREARAASALNHPNICTIHEFGDAGGRHFIVMEYVEGRTLHEVLSSGPMRVEEAIPTAIEIGEALAEAHRHGILHRDIKAKNVILTSRGRVKILDFGLAKYLPAGITEDGDASTEARLTGEGMTLGTLQYMSPEQLLGKPLDARSDLFSFGVLLYEMLMGRLPFQGSTSVAVADAILHQDPRPSGLETPPALQKIVLRMLAKEPADRYPSAETVCSELSALQPASGSEKLVTKGLAERSRSRAALVSAVIAIAAVLGAGIWLSTRQARVRWAREKALPEISRLAEQDKYQEAVALARQAEVIIPEDPILQKLWPQITREVSVETIPGGAEVFFKEYKNPNGTWEHLGRSPIAKARIPFGFYRWRFDKAGFRSAYRIWPSWLPARTGKLSLRLFEEGRVPSGMIPIPGDKFALTIPGLDNLEPVPIGDYLIDEYEVTNEEYKKFVIAGGYERREYWKLPFLVDGHALSFEEAMPRFHDATGRPGPATWELGDFPKGRGKFPVSGVSWYEAAAYAEFAGKRLPTIYEWNRAAETTASALVVPFSNFAGVGPVAVGSLQGMNGYGTYDMAGNVKEWCGNEAEAGKRYILGGGWNELTYMFIDQDAQSPWDRAQTFGFRCVRGISTKDPTPESARKITFAFRDFSKEKPPSDELFLVYRSLYAYDQSDLAAVVESTDPSPDDWTLQRITFNAAYGNERMIAYLLLPKRGKPPYQTLIAFPGNSAFQADKFGGSPGLYFEFPMKSGRALMLPVYKSTYERRDALRSTRAAPTSFYRDHVLAWAKDLERSIDYLETRPDIDHARLAYLGLSWGGRMGPIMLAVENRFKTAILFGGGLGLGRPLPEVDPINFLSRVKIPVLMLNGRYDHLFPVETSQLPMFRLLGSPEKDKRYIIYETGHIPPKNDVIKESLAWLDRYLGPVSR